MIFKLCITKDSDPCRITMIASVCSKTNTKVLKDTVILLWNQRNCFLKIMYKC